MGWGQGWLVGSMGEGVKGYWFGSGCVGGGGSGLAFRVMVM